MLWRIDVNGHPFPVEADGEAHVPVDGSAYSMALQGDTVSAGDESHWMQVTGPCGGRTAPAAVRRIRCWWELRQGR
ncbi:MAG: hypothetical protein PVH80_02860 [Anaerolineae bacterium]